jgi:hypothetical protein
MAAEAVVGSAAATAAATAAGYWEAAARTAMDQQQAHEAIRLALNALVVLRSIRGHSELKSSRQLTSTNQGVQSGQRVRKAIVQEVLADGYLAAGKVSSVWPNWAASDPSSKYCGT